MSAATSQRKRNTKPRGRPVADDAVDRRAAILEQAECLFARQGHAATSVRQVADAAGVTPAMVHYYFGNKASLLRQVLESALEPIARAIAAMREPGRERVPEIVRLMLGVFAQHPNLPALIAREVMLPGAVMQAHFLEFLAPRLGGSVPALLAVEQAEGRVGRDLDPHITALLLLALCAFPLIARDLAAPALRIDYSAAGMENLEAHINRLLRQGLTP